MLHTDWYLFNTCLWHVIDTLFAVYFGDREKVHNSKPYFGNPLKHEISYFWMKYLILYGFVLFVNP